MADEIEHKIRENAGIISNEMMTPPEATSADVESDEEGERGKYGGASGRGIT